MEALRDLESSCRWLNVNPREEVVGHLERNNDVFFVVEGRLQVGLSSLDGKEVRFRELSKGEIFGDLAAIDNQPRSASVVAAAPSLIAALPAEKFRALLLSQPRVAERQLLVLTKMVRDLTERVFEFSALVMKNRLHAELLRLAKDAPMKGDSVVIEPAPTHAELAARISSHREAVTRELRSLAREGLVVRQGRGLRISNMAELRNRVEPLMGWERQDLPKRSAK